jgi:hypothetical protein
MKKFLILLFVFISIISNAQSSFDFSGYEYNKFKVSGQALCGAGNAYCMVTRSQYQNQFGNYTYQIYFATNSYFGNCNPTRTYIPNIEIMYLEGSKWCYPQNYYKFWVTVGQTQLVYTLYHPYPNLQIKIRTGFMEPTIY